MGLTQALGLTYRRAGVPLQISFYVLVAVALFLVSGLATFGADLATGNSAWVDNFFRAPGAVLYVGTVVVNLVLTVLVWKEFQAGEPMKGAWRLIAAAAVCQALGTLAVQVLTPESPLNFLRHTSLWSETAAINFHRFGSVLNGSCRFGLLALGLWMALRVYRRAGFLGRLHVFDCLIPTALALYVFLDAKDLVRAFQKGKRFDGWKAAGPWIRCFACSVARLCCCIAPCA